MTNAELALLGLIVEQPCHGYQIEQIIEQRGMRDWTEIGFSSIYYLLKKLEGKSYIQSERQPSAGGGPGRKTYHTTEAGWEAWYQQSLACLAETDRTSGRLLLGIAALPALDRDQALGALQKHLKSLAERLSGMNARSEAQQPLPPHVDAMFDYSRKMIGSEVDWIRNLVADLEAGKFETKRE